VGESAGRDELHAEGAQGVQFGDGNLQLNVFSALGEVRRATAKEFQADLQAFLEGLVVRARRVDLRYLPTGADLTTFDRTVRVVARVRRPTSRDPADVPAGAAVAGRAVYGVPGELDCRRDDPPKPWPLLVGEADRVVVLGDAGLGKSWLLRSEAARLADIALTALDDLGAAQAGGDLVVPVLVRADALAGASGATLAEALTAVLIDDGLLPARSAAGLRELVNTGGVVVLVDALDEVPRHGPDGRASPRKRLEDLLRAWVQACSVPVRCVIASRLAGYAGTPVPGVREVELLPFTAEQTWVAVQAWQLGETAAALLTERLSDPAIAGMARNPLLLAFLCSLAAELPESAPLPATRVGLYEAIVWRLVSGAHHGVDTGGQAVLDDHERQLIMDALGQVALIAAESPHGWLDQIPYRLIAETNEVLAGSATNTDVPLLVERSGCLTPVGNPAVGEQLYMFLHRTIAEYLVARRLRDLSHARRMSIVERHRWFDPDWAVVIPMLAGLLDAHPDTPPDVRALLSALLTCRRDPLHHSLHTSLRALGELTDPDRHLTPALTVLLNKRARRLFRNETTRSGLMLTLTSATRLPTVITTALLIALTDKHSPARSEVARALAGRTDPAVTAALLTALTDSNESVRSAAVRALASRNEPTITTAVMTTLTDQEWIVRWTAARALAGRTDPAVTTALLTALTDSNESVREAAAQALASRNEPAVTAALLTALEDKDGVVRDAAAQALASRNEPTITAALLTTLTHLDPLVRRAATQALAGHHGPAITAALLIALADEHSAVRSAAAQALAGRNEPAVTTALLTALTDKDWAVQLQVARALSGHNAPAVTTALLTALSDQKWFVRSKAAQALASHRAPAATTALLTALRDKKWMVREAAARALASRNERAVTAALLTALTDKDESVREAAAQTLAGHDDPAVLSQLCRWPTRALLPGRQNARYELAEQVTDRLYLGLDTELRRDVFARLARLTRRVSWW
jgi:HEAT repeat protein